MTFVELTTVSKSFGADYALHQISASLQLDDFVLVTGSNGAGKSTLLKCIAGIYEPDTGTRHAKNSLTAYLSPTSLGLYEHLTVRQNLNFFSSLQPLQSSSDAAAYWGLFNFIDKKVSTLSLGQKMRVALARTFLQNSDVIVLDEPTVGLDEEGLQLLKQQLSQSSALIVVASHDPEFFKPLTTYHLTIHHGKVIDAVRFESPLVTPPSLLPQNVTTLPRLIKKDFALELSAKETILSLSNFSVLLYTLLAVGLANAVIADDVVRRIYPVLYWILFLLIGLLCADRSFSYETKLGAFTAVLLAKVSPRSIFISKWITTATTLFVAGALQGAIGYLLLGTSISTLPFLLILGSFSVGSVAVLLSAISSASKLPSLTLPLLALPTLTPLFLGLQELSYSGQDASPWTSILIGLNVVYFTLGINLYEFATKE